MEPFVEQSYIGSSGWLDNSYRVQTETRQHATRQRQTLPHIAEAFPRWLHPWWERRATDMLWLVVFATLNAAVFAWRFTCFPRDSAAGRWPAVAKGSAELVLLNTVVALLAVCYRFVGHFNVAMRRGANAISLLPPLDKPLALHKVAGMVVISASVLHSLAWFIIFARVRECSLEKWQASAYHDRFAFVREAPSVDTILRELPVWTGVLMLACLAVAVPFCTPCIRERSFKYFALAHSALAPFVLLLLIHGVECWTGALQTPFWLATALLAYGAERMHRLPLLLLPLRIMPKSRAEATIVLATRLGDTLMMQLSGSETFRRHLEPGMYVFVAVPALSRWEWHPFSVASAPEDATMHLHIRIIGDWTKALSHALLQSNQGEDDNQWNRLRHQLVVHLDGPVSSPTVLFCEYMRVALISTGVGVTPHLSVLRHVLHLRRQQRAGDAACRIKLRMIWSTRDVRHVQWVLDTLDEFSAELDASPGAFAIDLHVTGLPSLDNMEAHDSRRQLIDRMTFAARRFASLHVDITRIFWPKTIDHLLATMGMPVPDALERGDQSPPPPLGVFVCSRASLAKQIKRDIAAAVVARRATSSQTQRVNVFAEGF